MEEQQSRRPHLLVSDDIFATLYHEERLPEILVIATQWYLNYLTQKLLEAWPLISEVVCGLTKGHRPKAGDEKIITSLLSAIVEEFQHGNLSLVDITDKLYNEEIVR